MLVYDIARRASFESLDRWLREIREYSDPSITIMLVGNKSDMHHLRVVSKEEAEHFAAVNRLSFMETSALESSNTGPLFQRLLTGKLQHPLAAWFFMRYVC